jgi:hypothetical protein
MKNSLFGQLLWLFYLPLFAPMGGFLVAASLGVSNTLRIIGFLGIMSLGAWALSYVRMSGMAAKRMARACMLVSFSFGAAAAAAFGYGAVMMPLSGTSLLLMLLCVAMYSLFTGLSIGIPLIRENAMQEPAPTPKPKNPAKPMIILTPGKTQVVVSRIKRGMPQQLPKKGGTGDAQKNPPPSNAMHM